MAFLPYEEPSIVQILVLISFLVFLPLSEWIAGRLIRAGILGPLLLGMIYGEPLANILLEHWQETFLELGYIGLITIIFEGGLTSRLDLVQRYLILSFFAAAIGICFPIGLSFLLLNLAFGYGAVETFIIGASLSSTSLGTTLAVISAASSNIDLSQSRVGTVLVIAAIIDDVVALVMSSVIRHLGNVQSGSQSLGWLIGRPVLASVLMAVITPLLTRYVLAPFYRKTIEHRIASFGHKANVTLLVPISAAFLAIAAYAGTSVLFGAFLAGLFLAYIPSATHTPSFAATYAHYFGTIQSRLLSPLFFASIGFAVPFLDLWTGKAIWRGVVYVLLMSLGKSVVGLSLPIWDWLVSTPSRRHEDEDAIEPRSSRGCFESTVVAPSVLLGAAMVARGEIGLLILEIGFNNTSYVSPDGFITGVWAILLATILGPVTVGMWVKRFGKDIAHGPWGLDLKNQDETVDGVGHVVEEEAKPNTSASIAE